MLCTYKKSYYVYNKVDTSRHNTENQEEVSKNILGNKCGSCLSVHTDRKSLKNLSYLPVAFAVNDVTFSSKTMQATGNTIMTETRQEVFIPAGGSVSIGSDCYQPLIAKYPSLKDKTKLV